MTDYLTLTEFVPGTKAKAQEVNANFAAVKDAISTKASAEGDSTKTFSIADATEDSHAVTKSQLDALSDEVEGKINAASTRFCAKSGNVTSGKADLFSYSLLTITPKIGGSYANLVVSDCNGALKTFSSGATLNMSGKADGTYNLYIKPDGTFYVAANKIYVQATRPTLVDGDVWVNTSVEPINAIKYTSASDETFLDVPLGKVTIASSAITALTTNPYNQNGYDVNRQTNDYNRIIPNYSNIIGKSAGVAYTAECDGWIRGYNFSSGAAYYYINGVARPFQGGNGSTIYVGASFFIPISKDDTYYVDAANYYFDFIPAKGGN